MNCTMSISPYNYTLCNSTWTCLLAIACVFTVAGGLTAVIWTDFVQTILMIIGAFILCAKGNYFLLCIG